MLLDFEIVNNWFYEDAKSWHYMCLGKNLDKDEVLNFDNLTIKSSKEVEVVGIKVGKNLKAD